MHTTNMEKETSALPVLHHPAAPLLVSTVPLPCLHLFSYSSLVLLVDMLARARGSLLSIWDPGKSGP